MDKKLIASDIDGTLLFDKETGMQERNMYVKDVDLEALAVLRDLGTKVTLCSGRPRVGIEDFLQIADVTFDYYIAMNGAVIYNAEWEPIHEQTMSHALACEIVETVFSHATDVRITGFTEDETFNFWEKDESLADSFLTRGESYTIEELRANPREYTQFAMHFTTGEHEDKFARMVDFAKVMQEHFDGRLEAYRNSIYLDITALGVSKGKAIHQLADKIGVCGEETVAIGDGWNDLSMLQDAGVSYTFHHAEEELKQHATHVVETFAEMAEHLIKKA